MKQIGVTELKEQCFGILGRLDAEGLIISRRGEPIARLLPIEAAGSDLIGALRGKLKTTGDIMSTGLRWENES